MKLTKTKLEQLIRESLGWGGFATDDNLEDSDSLPAEKGLFDHLSKEEKELAEKMLWWWSEQIDKKGRESTLTGKDPEPFHRMWQDWDTIDLGMGTEDDLKLIRDALINWPFWGERGDRLIPETKALASKIKAILSGDMPEQEPEPEAAAQKRSQLGTDESDPRFAGLEFDEALQRYKEGQVMKLTRSKLHQLIREELENQVANGPIPVKDFTWKGEELKLNSAHGVDSWSTIRTPEAFEEWKATVLSHGEGSEVVLDKHGRWAPAAGPWKEKSDAYRAGKAQDMARYGSH